MTPVQRVTRYNLLLSDIAKCFKKAGDEEIYENLRSALEHAHEICEYANNMMIAGRISGFPVSTYYNYYTLNSHSAYVAMSTEYYGVKMDSCNERSPFRMRKNLKDTCL